MNITYSQYQLEVVLAVFSIYFISTIVMGWYKLTPKPLYKHSFFWASILLPITIFFILAFFDVTNGRVASKNGINHYEISTFTFSVLALIIPIVSIIASIHRSIQTDEQIRVTEKKNESDKYYAHQKYIVEAFNSLNKHEVISSSNGKNNNRTISVSNPHKLYRQAFKNASPDNANLTINKFIEEGFTLFWQWTNNALCEVKRANSPQASANFIHQVEGRLVGLSRHLGVSRPFGPYSANIQYKGIDITTSFLNEDDFIRTMHCYIEVTSEICDILNINLEFGKICIDVMNYIYGNVSILECYNTNYTSLIPHRNATLAKI